MSPTAPELKSTVRIQVPATTANLGPGFDCLGMALRLYNKIEMTVANSGGLQIEVHGPAASEHIPLDERNLVYRCAARVFELAGREVPDLHLKLTLTAPLARGLGSSAAAIVGGMLAANKLLHDTVPEKLLLREMVLMEGHPDNVVPCFRGGLTASIIMPDGTVQTIRQEPSPRLRFVVLIPGYELSTAKARQAIPKSVSVKDAVFNLGRVPFVLSSLATGDTYGLSTFMDDRLHQPYRKPLIRLYDLIAAQAEAAGAAAVCISGAGPTVLGVVPADRAQAVAAAWGDVTAATDIGGQVLVLEADNRGAVVLE